MPLWKPGITLPDSRRVALIRLHTNRPADFPVDTLQSLLDRPVSERLRESKYRFAQSVVFGLPVLALQWFGYRLGGTEADRWIGLLQLLLAGWIMYVGAAGLLFEG